MSSKTTLWILFALALLAGAVHVTASYVAEKLNRVQVEFGGEFEEGQRSADFDSGVEEQFDDSTLATFAELPAPRSHGNTA